MSARRRIPLVVFPAVAGVLGLFFSFIVFSIVPFLLWLALGCAVAGLVWAVRRVRDRRAVKKADERQ